MSRKSPRIETAGRQAPLANPFANLQVEGLPEAKLQPVAEAAAAAKPSSEAMKRGRVVLRRETAHRSGKAVIIVTHIPPALGAGEIDQLAKKLRTVCGAGGTVKEREIEVQGDQAARVRSVLEAEGFRVDGER